MLIHIYVAIPSVKMEQIKIYSEWNMAVYALTIFIKKNICKIKSTGENNSFMVGFPESGPTYREQAPQL